MTGCPWCGKVTDETTQGFRRSCPKCNRRLTPCPGRTSCSAPVATDDGHPCRLAGYGCANGHTFHLSVPHGNMHHHAEDLGDNEDEGEPQL